MTYKILIIFKDGSKRVIPGVTKHGVNDNGVTFYFMKNGNLSYISMDSVTFFGRDFDWHEGEEVEEVPQTIAHWVYWGGWGTNHDFRIEDAKCSLCDYHHPTVRGSRAPDNLAKTCPSCGSKMVGK